MQQNTAQCFVCLHVFLCLQGACCNTDQGSCSHTATASACSALNPTNTFSSTKNCSTACDQPPPPFAGITVDVRQTSRNPKTLKVGQELSVAITVKAPKAKASDVTAALIIPHSLKFVGVNPPGKHNRTQACSELCYTASRALKHSCRVL